MKTYAEIRSCIRIWSLVLFFVAIIVATYAQSMAVFYLLCAGLATLFSLSLTVALVITKKETSMLYLWAKFFGINLWLWSLTLTSYFSSSWFTVMFIAGFVLVFGSIIFEPLKQEEDMK